MFIFNRTGQYMYSIARFNGKIKTKHPDKEYGNKTSYIEKEYRLNNTGLLETIKDCAKQLQCLFYCARNISYNTLQLL